VRRPAAGALAGERLHGFAGVAEPALSRACVRAQVGTEEYYYYVFPEEAGAAPNLKLLEAAYRWKRQKVDDADT